MTQLVGTIRESLKREFGPNLEKAIDKAIDKHPTWKEFYILAHANNYGKDLYTKFMIVPIEMNSRIDEVKMLGTMCFYVNVKMGLCDLVWCLPFDVPTEGLVDLEDEFVEEIAEEIYESKIPIIY